MLFTFSLLEDFLFDLLNRSVRQVLAGLELCTLTPEYPASAIGIKSRPLVNTLFVTALTYPLHSPIGHLHPPLNSYVVNYHSHPQASLTATVSRCYACRPCV